MWAGWQEGSGRAKASLYILFGQLALRCGGLALEGSNRVAA
jgi:hypothetical protein